jgi:hypothetical protein
MIDDDGMEVAREAKIILRTFGLLAEFMESETRGSMRRTGNVQHAALHLEIDRPILRVHRDV